MFLSWFLTILRLVHEQGVLAKNKDLVKAFGTDNQLEVCRIILDKGEMQVRSGEGRGGERERERDLEQALNRKIQGSDQRAATLLLGKRCDFGIRAYPQLCAELASNAYNSAVGGIRSHVDSSDVECSCCFVAGRSAPFTLPGV